MISQRKGWCKDHLIFAATYISNNPLLKQAEGDMYEWGTYRGETAQLMEGLFASYQIKWNQLLAIDSFEGLPDEAPGVQRFYLFNKGVFNDVHFLYPIRGKYIKRWFDQMTPQDVIDYAMKPAKLIHIDSDLYVSAKQALDFMFQNKLVTENTLVGFDEYKSTEPLYAGGEAMAWKLASEQYGVESEELFRNIYMDGGIECWQSTFIVKKVN
jgi:hypothetical protein